jgi:hypothetical protein
MRVLETYQLIDDNASLRDQLTARNLELDLAKQDLEEATNRMGAVVQRLSEWRARAKSQHPSDVVSEFIDFMGYDLELCLGLDSGV